ncbi:MAG: RrF2 family transcriptional regulator [Candidatus Fimadaptatus sp.]|jgi:Rrf2 family cysteine metabolism transcriptional repressor
MKLSMRARYGIHAMFYLAQHAGEPPQPLKTIAETEGIPEPYLEQLMSPLRKQGLVTSSRGAQGGYTLSAAPGSISIGSVLRALEGSLAPVSCLENDDACGKTCDCASRLVWRRLQLSIEQAMDAMTLQDMLDDYAGVHDIDKTGDK